jgi:heme/copper-type cytochrome/quinol oxidase subunit 2
MNKQSLIFITAGILLLIVLGYFLLKPSSKQESTLQNNQPTQRQVNNQSVEQKAPELPLFIEAVFEYTTGVPLEPKVVRVEEGQKVVIKATADVADEVHVHGYNNTVEIKPGVPAVLEFTATKTGRFPIELEKLKKDIGVIEVYPK